MTAATCFTLSSAMRVYLVNPSLRQGRLYSELYAKISLYFKSCYILGDSGAMAVQKDSFKFIQVISPRAAVVPVPHSQEWPVLGIGTGKFKFKFSEQW